MGRVVASGRSLRGAHALAIAVAVATSAASAAITSGAAGCAPVVDTPADQQRAVDVRDGDRLAAQVRLLPGVVRAEVTLERPVADPLGTEPARNPALAIVTIVDDRADRAATRANVVALAHALAPALPATVIVEVGAIRPTLADVGPFAVEAHSKRPLKAVLALLLALVAALAAALAVRQRRGKSAQ